MESQGVHVVAMSSNADPGDKAEYRRLDDDHSSLSIVQGNKCILHISHFTGFTSVAQSSTQKQNVDIQEQTPAIKKLIDIIGFHGDLNPQVKKLPLRLYCVNKTDDAKQLVLEEEHQLRGHQADAPKTMSVVNNQRDVEFHLSEIDQSWKIGGTGPIQYVDIEAVMSSSFSACSYSMSRQDKSTNAFDCTVSAFQRDNPKYDENNRLPIHFTINEPLISDPTDMATRYTLQQHPRRSLRLKYRDRLKLSHLLDPASPLGNDWRMVADKMSLSYDTIQQIERQYQVGTVLSPTREVLNYWEATKKDAAIDELLVILEDIERLDAVEFLRNVLSESKTEAQSSN
ncbi:netrin receptor UNC5B-like [Ptychodera flava]|uniref:netrin receptor UNC5B-like n=1 Tax=Ptychodera flava TaxID=63121 RepID=UPI00396A2DD9